MECPSCNLEVTLDTDTIVGKKVVIEYMFCPSCGYIVHQLEIREENCTNTAT